MSSTGYLYTILASANFAKVSETSSAITHHFDDFRSLAAVPLCALIRDFRGKRALPRSRHSFI